MAFRCPDIECGSWDVNEVATLSHSSYGWSFHTTTQPLLQCKKCKTVFVPPIGNYDYERGEYRG